MKERQILFKGPLVRAILAGQKTVTRRVVKPQFQTAPVDVVDGVPSWDSPTNYAGEVQMNTQRGKPCPYGKPGDRLWVREAWAADAQVDAVAPRDLSQGEPIHYPADGAVRQTGCAMITPGKGRPSIHMPRWVSRILLEVTAVRVERLQDITEEQARAEGCTADDDPFWHPTYNDPDSGGRPSHRNTFEYLWGEINGADAWAANPWVWVVEFKRVTPP